MCGQNGGARASKRRHAPTAYTARVKYLSAAYSCGAWNIGAAQGLYYTATTSCFQRNDQHGLWWRCQKAGQGGQVWVSAGSGQSRPSSMLLPALASPFWPASQNIVVGCSAWRSASISASGSCSNWPSLWKATPTAAAKCMPRTTPSAGRRLMWQQLWMKIHAETRGGNESTVGCQQGWTYDQWQYESTIMCLR